MRQATIDRMQKGHWDHLGDSVEVFAPGADVDADDPVWSGLAIRIVPDPTDAPNEGLGYQQSVNGFSFRASDAPSVPQQAIVRYAGRSYTVDEVSEVGVDKIVVTVGPPGAA